MKPERSLKVIGSELFDKSLLFHIVSLTTADTDFPVVIYHRVQRLYDFLTILCLRRTGVRAVSTISYKPTDGISLNFG